MDDYVRLSQVHSRRRRRLLLAASLLAGTVLGVAGAAVAGWLWARSYLESQKFWADVSQSTGYAVSAGLTQARLLPPGIRIKDVVVQKEGGRVLEIAEINVGLSPLALMADVADLNVQLDRVTILPPAQAVTSASPINNTGVPRTMAPATGLGIAPGDLPLRRLELKVVIAELKLPTNLVPRTDVELAATVTPRDRKASVELKRFKALGLEARGHAEVDGRLEGPFQLTFSDASLVAGTIAGKLSTDSSRLGLKAELRLPPRPVEIPPGTRWLASGRYAELSGRASLVGNVSAVVGPLPQWSVDAGWDLDLTSAGLAYGAYTKSVGSPASVRGRLTGTNESWSLGDLSVRLGNAQASGAVESGTGKGVHVTAHIAPFQLAPFLPLFAAVAPPELLDAAKVSGEAAAEVELTVAPDGEPTGTVSVDVNDWSIDGNALRALGAGFDTSGELIVKGKVAGALEHGSFRSGQAKLVFDATDLGLRLGESFEKKTGVPLVLDIVAEGAGRSIAIRGARLQGPGGLKIVAQGTVADLKDFETELVIVESRLPLKTVAELLPKATAAGGSIELSGTLRGALKSMEGWFTKLQLKLRNVALAYDKLEVRKLSGELETVLSDSTPDSSEVRGRSWLVRAEELSGEWLPGGEPKPAPVALTLEGQASFQDGALTGDLTANAETLDLRAWLKAPGLPPELAALDPRRSNFKVSASAERVLTPYLELSDLKAQLKLGRGGGGTADLTFEPVSAHAAGGELTLGARATPGQKLEFSASASGVDLAEVASALGRYAGHPLDRQLFGRGELELSGSLASALVDLKGSADIREGGFGFLPLPRSVFSQLKKLGVEPAGARSVDRLDKSHAEFHLKGSQLELDVSGTDAHLGELHASGLVSVGGHCALEGSIRLPKGVLPADAVLPYDVSGEGWNCAPHYQLGPLQKSLKGPPK